MVAIVAGAGCSGTSSMHVLPPVASLTCVKLHEGIFVAGSVAVEGIPTGGPPTGHAVLLAGAICNVCTLAQTDREVAAGTQHRDPLLAAVAVELRQVGRAMHMNMQRVSRGFQQVRA